MCSGFTSCARVLIPLNSGLAWSLAALSRLLTTCLNPFEFRAGLERFGENGYEDSAVLIPLNSGLAWSSKVEKTLA